MHTSSTTESFTQEQIFYCSFCSKSNKQVRQLISGPNDVYICDECVDIAHQIVQERRARQSESG